MFNLKNIFNSLSNNLKPDTMAKETNNATALPDYIKSKNKKQLAANFDDVQSQMKQFDGNNDFKVNVEAVNKTRDLFDETNDQQIEQLRFYVGVAVSQLNYCLTKSK